MPENITEAFVKDRVPRLMPKGKDEWKVRDTKVTGFMLRCRRAADETISREFFFDYLPPATGDEKPNRKRLSIGKWPVFTADEAREQARLMLQGLKEGTDPAHARAAKKAEPIFDELWTDFKEGHLSLKEKGTVKDYTGRYRRVLLPAFKGRKVSSITRAEVDALRRKYKDKPTEFNRGLAVLSKMMNRAIVKGWRTDNPVKLVERFKEDANETWINETDRGPFIEALGKVPGPMGDFLRFLTVTGWRVTAARKLRWDQVDLKELEVRLDNKATKITATALSADAAMILDSQPHRMGYVFTRSKGREPLDYRGVLAELTAVCKAAGIKRVTPHTLRRTIATHSAIDGANVAELMQSYGWKTPAMAMRYVKKSESLARKGVERGANVMNIFRRGEEKPADGAAEI
ncbi:tyrosine-type recombinase/integrase [Sinorhizobium medicae]|nr:tyrosine-type recombinase/integrase [Sinorhizobium medicae]